jgi:hypothetical protein
MELFVQAIVVGGLALVLGLWFFEAEVGGTLAWYGGAAFALAGLLTIGAGIWLKLEPGES